MRVPVTIFMKLNKKYSPIHLITMQLQLYLLRRCDICPARTHQQKVERKHDGRIWSSNK